MNKTPNMRLRRQRELRGWSQQKLADALGTSEKRVSHWERGESFPDRYYQTKLVELFGMTAEELGLLKKPDCTEVPLAPQRENAVTPLKSQPIKENTIQESHIIQIVLPKDGSTLTVQIYQQPSAYIGSGNTKNDIITYEQQVLPVLGSGLNEMDGKRREFLGLLGAASGVLLLSFPDLDWERISSTLQNSSFIDELVIQDFEIINSRYWNLYFIAPSKSAILEGVSGQFKVLVQFLKNSHTMQIHKRLCALSSDLCQLVGEIFFDQHEYDAAKACYALAMSTAKEAGALDLWSSALIRYSFLPLYEEQYNDALLFLQKAQQLAQRGDSSLSTRYWAAAVEAEAEAGRGNLSACQSALEKANGVFAVKNNPSWLRFEGSRLSALQGACYVRLQRPDLARPALQEALQTFSKPTRRRGLVLADMATAAIQCQDIEQACVYVKETANLVYLSSSDFLRGEVHKLRHRLEPFSEMASVKLLDQQLRTLL